MCHLSPDATEEQECPLTSYPSNGNPPPEPSLVTPKASQLPSAQPLPLRTSGKEVTYLGNPFRPPPIRSPFRRDHPISAEPKPPVAPTNYRGLGIYSSCDCRPDQRAVAAIRRNAGVLRPLEKQNLDCGHCNGSWEMRDELRCVSALSFGEQFELKLINLLVLKGRRIRMQQTRIDYPFNPHPLKTWPLHRHLLNPQRLNPQPACTSLTKQFLLTPTTRRGTGNASSCFSIGSYPLHKQQFFHPQPLLHHLLLHPPPRLNRALAFRCLAAGLTDPPEPHQGSQDSW